MLEPLPAKGKPANKPWQWSVKSLLAATALVAVWLSAWRFHFLLGITLTMLLLPAVLYYFVTLCAGANTFAMKVRAYGLFILFGALFPPVLIVATSPGGTPATIAYQIAMGALAGAVMASAYGVYVMLFALVLEWIFGGPPKKGDLA